MKKLIVLGVALVLACAGSASAQTAFENLQNNCIVYPSAAFISCNEGSRFPRILTMWEYGDGSDADGTAFAFEMTSMYLWEHTVVPREEVAADVWSLVSRQVHGEPGRLALAPHGNFIPTNDSSGSPALVLIMWSRSKGKWLILSMPLSKIKTLNKGVRMFAERS